MGKMIQVSRPDGGLAPAYAAQPPEGDSAPAVVVVQEWWGLDDQIRRVADRLAQAGFRVLVPDLYRGRVTTSGDEASHLMEGLSWADAVLQDLRGALIHLHRPNRKAAVIGFCMGGALTLIAAEQVPELAAAVCFYGIPPAGLADPSKIRVPLLAHFASEDDWCTPSAVDALQAQLDTGSVPYELFRYADTQHAFMNEARPEVYDAKAAGLAWDRTVAFLKKTLA